MPYVKKYKKYTKNTKKKSVKKSTGSKSSLVKTIKAVVNRQAETKHIDMDPEEYPFQNTEANDQNTIMYDPISLSDNLALSQGVTDGKREGNQVNITKCILNINALANSETVSPAIISIYVGYVKADRSTVPNPFKLTQFLQDGSSATSLNNTTLSLLRNVNKDLFTITNSVRFKIGQSTGGMNNNDFPAYVNKKMNIKSLLGKMRYNDTESAPSKDLFIWMHVTGIDGQPIFMSSRPYIVNYYLDTEFKDF